VIEWTAPEPAALIMANDPQFAGAQELYRGPNSSFFLSGLGEGTYYLILRDGAGRQSQPVQLTVAHQSLTRALWLTAAGMIITLAIVATIVRGARP
jgi:hypothetical protein